MRRRTVVIGFAAVGGMFALITAFYLFKVFITPSLTMARLEGVECVVKYGRKGGYFIEVPERLNLHDFVSEYGETLNSIALAYPINITVHHKTLDEQSIGSLGRLQGNIILNVDENALTEMQVRELRAPAKLRAVILTLGSARQAQTNDAVDDDL